MTAATAALGCGGGKGPAEEKDAGRVPTDALPPPTDALPPPVDAAASGTAVALQVFVGAWCTNWENCYPATTPCCWETTIGEDPASAALLDQCRADVVELGCAIQEQYVEDGGILTSRLTSDACRALFAAGVAIGAPNAARPWGPYTCATAWYRSASSCTCVDQPYVTASSDSWASTCAAAQEKACLNCPEMCNVGFGVDMLECIGNPCDLVYPGPSQADAGTQAIAPHG